MTEFIEITIDNGDKILLSKNLIHAVILTDDGTVIIKYSSRKKNKTLYLFPTESYEEIKSKLI